ncbi:MAG TPA: acyl-CoA dehydrogenase family protein, partial [Streptosporangiaceae bacterium]|nr:acyl-CoA dehydrogenase family protein [Streptosporangiaceae bacterium]
MDYDFSASQQRVVATVDRVIDASGGIERAFALAVAAGYDRELDRALADAGVLDGSDLLERVLVAERLAELGVATTYGMRGVIDVDGLLPPGGVAVAVRGRHGPVRYASVADHVVLVDGDDLIAVDDGAKSVTRVRSGFGYPYARIAAEELDGTRLTGMGEAWRTRLSLVTAAEIAGNAAAAISRTAAHMRVREQFGRTLSTFQALRHRLAEAAVSAEATRWMVREAAFTADPRDIELAASYAAQTAAQLVPELVQMCGARSFTLEFGLHVFTMRLDGLRLELGSPDRLAAR